MVMIRMAMARMVSMRTEWKRMVRSAMSMTHINDTATTITTTWTTMMTTTTCIDDMVTTTTYIAAHLRQDKIYGTSSSMM